MNSGGMIEQKYMQYNITICYTTCQSQSQSSFYCLIQDTQYSVEVL